MNRTELLGLGGRTRSGRILILASLLFGAFGLAGASRAWGATASVDEVVAGILANAARVGNFECVVNCRALNRGANGRVLQDISQRRHFWCDRAAGLVRDEYEDGSGIRDLYDGKAKKWKRRSPKMNAEEALPVAVSSMSDLWPSPKFVYFPAELFDSYNLEVVGAVGNKVRLTGRIKGDAPASRTHAEFEVDAKKGIILSVSLYGPSGDLIQRIRLRDYKNFKGCWLPTRILDRRNAQNNAVDVDMTYDMKSINEVTPNAFTLQ